MSENVAPLDPIDSEASSAAAPVEPLPEAFIEAVRPHLAAPAEAWTVANVTSSYPFLDGEQVFWVRDGAHDRSVMVLEDLSGGFGLLTGEAGMELIQAVIQEKLYGDPVRKLGLDGCADLLREWHDDFRGRTLSRDFLAVEEENLNEWLLDPARDRDALRAACVEPDYFISEDGHWLLQFNVLTRHGGVERWAAVGEVEEFTLDVVDIEPIHPPGTFRFPIVY